MQRTLRLVEITGVPADRVDDLPARFSDLALHIRAAEQRAAEAKSKKT